MYPEEHQPSESDSDSDSDSHAWNCVQVLVDISMLSCETPVCKEVTVPVHLPVNGLSFGDVLEYCRVSFYDFCNVWSGYYCIIISIVIH